LSKLFATLIKQIAASNELFAASIQRKACLTQQKAAHTEQNRRISTYWARSKDRNFRKLATAGGKGKAWAQALKSRRPKRRCVLKKKNGFRNLSEAVLRSWLRLD